MASSLDFTSMVSLVLLVTLAIFANSACSTSRGVLDHQKLNDIGFRVTLQHVDSGKNLTKFERIQHGIRRGEHRLQRLNAMVLDASTDASQISSPILAGNGEFLMKLSIGTPPEAYSAIIDTGSDLIWTQCKPCTKCYSQPTPIFDPKTSSSFSKLPCSSELCKALPQPTCKDGCEYYYSYGDYSSTQGILASETFTFGDVSVPNVGFGCGDENEGDGFTQAAGLVGLGRGQLSLVSQLKEPKFSYCLTSIEETQTGSLLMGSLASLNSTKTVVKTTPLIKNPSQPSFYYLSLEGITVGETKLSIDKSTFALQDDGSGGLIIDSGTTITYLEESAFDLVKKEFKDQINLPLDRSGATGLDLCFILPKGADEVKVPKLIFHFDGADLDLPGENYMIGDSSSGELCLAMGSSNGMSIFGNIQQQNLLVHHDLEKQTLSFVPTQCDQL
ncbi:aspartic proteinase nepenthesin-1-like [Tripterygium wilfordii]|uniref:aspartic proteinase nepenthesin-1-like n=1 Tax=Tripterygium wilfordii TaxID=458696 RepID=UPI0018F7E912|nr:aspartic proteinase nepenthesin-1-like [Tripterygium wilfordii]